MMTGLISFNVQICLWNVEDSNQSTKSLKPFAEFNYHKGAVGVRSLIVLFPENFCRMCAGILSWKICLAQLEKTGKLFCKICFDEIILLIENICAKMGFETEDWRSNS